MRHWLILAFLLIAARLASAQLTTAVTANVADHNGSVYVNCSWSVTFVGQNTQPGVGPYAPAALLNGQQGRCDSFGNISVALADNLNTVTPTPSQWQFNICSASGYTAGPYCSGNILVTITGTSQNITSTIDAAMPVLPPLGSGGSPSGSTGFAQVRTSLGTFGSFANIDASQSSIPSANTAATSAGGGDINSTPGYTETDTSEIDLGINNHLHFYPNSTLTFGGSAGAGLKLGSDGRISGETVSQTAIQTSATFNGSSLITNNSASEFFELDRLRLSLNAASTVSNAGLDIQGGFIPSYMDQVVITPTGGFGSLTALARFTISPSITGESAGDYMISRSWFNCTLQANCQPFKMISNTGGSHIEHVTLLDNGFEHPGSGISVSPFTADGTTGGIYQLNQLSNRYEGNAVDTTQALATLNNVDSTNIWGPWCAPLASGNPTCFNFTGTTNMVTLIGAQSFTSHLFNNAMTGRAPSQDYVPLYIFLSHSSGIGDIFESDTHIFSSAGNNNMTFHFNSGQNASEQTDVFWDDQSTSEWDWQKAATTNNYQLLDVQNSSHPRISLVPGGHTIIDAFSTSDVEFNSIANAGTGGVSFYSGGGSPTKVASVDSSGNFSGNSMTSTVTTGTPPIVVTSTTPVAHLAAGPTAYNAGGTQQTNTHMVYGTCTLGTNCGITLTASAAFTSSSSYVCTATDQTATNAVRVNQTAANGFTITGTGTDVIGYQCVGD